MSNTSEQGAGGHRSEHRSSGGNDHPTQTLSIVVYRGDPVDAQSTRHTAFFIEFSSGSNVLSHVTGASGFFDFQEKWDIAPRESRSFERLIPVITLQTSAPDDLTMRNIMRGIPVNNVERAWNCQSWIGDGLRVLQEAGLIPAAAATSAADQMVDVLREAPDED